MSLRLALNHLIDYPTGMKMKNYIYDDGGRAKSGRKGVAGDCGCRAMAIATGIPYDECYKLLSRANHQAGGKRSARNGVYKWVYEEVLQDIGWVWCKAPKFEGRKAYHYDMPEEAVIGRMAGHYCAIINGVVHDSWDSTRKMIYGYWKKKD